MNFAGLETMGVDELPSDYGRWLIHGMQGSGKTTLASTVARLGKTLFIDLVGEKGVRAFQGADYARNIDVIRPTSITSLDDIYWSLAEGGHPYKAVVVDSLTSVQKMAMRYLLGHDETAVKEIKQGVAPADMRTWGQSLDIMVDTATFWYGLADGNRKAPMHVVMTAQSKIIESEDTGYVTRTPDVQKGALSIVMATPDYVVYTDLEEDMDNQADDGSPVMRNIMRLGADPSYRTKARIPASMRGKVPSVIGRGKNGPDLATLSRVLGIGGVPKEAAKKTATKKAAAPAEATN